MNYKFLFLSVFLLAAGCGDVSTAADRITLIHLNDTYRIDAVEDGSRGGFGRVSTVLQELTAAGNDVVLTHGGDFLFPSLESQLWAGEQMIEALNFLHARAPLYAVPGNHEFDPRSPAAVIAAIRASNFTWVADNMRLNTGQADVDQALQQSLVIDMGDRKVGILALTLLPGDGGNVRDYAPVDGPYIATAERVLGELEAQGVDVIVGITHLHLADDKRIAKLKASHPLLQVIVGGHEHEPEFAEGDENTAMIVKGSSNARVIWQIDIDFSAAGPAAIATSIDIDESIVEDAEYQPIADKWRQRLLAKIPFLPSTVGAAAVPLDAREVTIRNEESGWGNFVVDQMPAAFGEPVADFAFVNSGTLRIDDYVAGDITFEDIGRTFGFSSFLRHMTINGAAFRNLLEAGYRGEGPSKGYFPQISGFRVCVDRSQPDGQRIVQLQKPTAAGWQAVQADTQYTLVAPDYIYGGGDGYDFSAAQNVSRAASELKYLVLDGVIRAQAIGEAVGGPVDPDNPRIAFASVPGSLCFGQ